MPEKPQNEDGAGAMNKWRQKGADVKLWLVCQSSMTTLPLFNKQPKINNLAHVWISKLQLLIDILINALVIYFNLS